ncbi:glycine zipper 2TM domain-containing protein [Stenotrophomonas sp. C3(2023)]|uniref:glycine zipper 2TM domain-containing protein n=1 Tax=Stenotrophomonas sp. C3(2023) TaxID=3080277 RepID=UPI00293C4C01|nr:glycine zipper 2TM domain-containing protein [Stenotrophomonas sp. C3(2023)]MDV3470012.1 glycine zipper 2TM domain-containing protein [Stenotrophomonas sp. C3(2023)]
MFNANSLSFRGIALALVLVGGAAAVGDADAMSRKDKRTLIGAAVGGVAGHVVSNGDPTMTIGGAVAGGAIGNLTTKDHDRRDYRHDRRYDHRYDRRNQARHWDNGRRHDKRHHHDRRHHDRRRHGWR